MDCPIACNLADAESQERRQTILASFRGAVLEIVSLPLGYAYRFRSSSETLEFLRRLVDLEGQCCPFLTFSIAIETGDQPICLEITGPAEAKGLIADLFGS